MFLKNQLDESFPRILWNVRFRLLPDTVNIKYPCIPVGPNARGTSRTVGRKRVPERPQTRAGAALAPLTNTPMLYFVRCTASHATELACPLYIHMQADRRPSLTPSGLATLQKLPMLPKTCF